MNDFSPPIMDQVSTMEFTSFANLLAGSASFASSISSDCALGQVHDIINSYEHGTMTITQQPPKQQQQQLVVFPSAITAMI